MGVLQWQLPAVSQGVVDALVDRLARHPEAPEGGANRLLLRPGVAGFEQQIQQLLQQPGDHRIAGGLGKRLGSSGRGLALQRVTPRPVAGRPRVLVAGRGGVVVEAADGDATALEGAPLGQALGLIKADAAA